MFVLVTRQIVRDCLTKIDEEKENSPHCQEEMLSLNFLYPTQPKVHQEVAFH